MFYIKYLCAMLCGLWGAGGFFCRAADASGNVQGILHDEQSKQPRHRRVTELVQAALNRTKAESVPDGLPEVFNIEGQTLRKDDLLACLKDEVAAESRHLWSRLDAAALSGNNLEVLKKITDMLCAQNVKRAFFLRGILLEKTGAPEDAIIAAFRLAVSADNPQACLKLGLVYLRSGRQEDVARGKETLCEAIGTGSAEAAYLLGKYVEDNEKNGKDAQEIYEKACGLAPVIPDAFYRRGCYLLNVRKDYPEAMKYLKSAVTRQHIDAYLALGKLYRKTGETEIAAEHYVTMLQIALPVPTLNEAAYQLAKILEDKAYEHQDRQYVPGIRDPEYKRIYNQALAQKCANALRLYKRSASLGHGKSMRNLSHMLENLNDHTGAQYWAREAMLNGVPGDDFFVSEPVEEKKEAALAPRIKKYAGLASTLFAGVFAGMLLNKGYLGVLSGFFAGGTEQGGDL